MAAHALPSPFAALHRTLLEERDPRARAGLHLELARLQTAEGNVENAARHLREAIALDATLDAARSRLEELSSPGPKVSGLRGLFSRRG